MLPMRIVAALLAGLVFASGAYAQTALKDKSPETAKALKAAEEAVAAGKQGQAERLRRQGRGSQEASHLREQELYQL